MSIDPRQSDTLAELIAARAHTHPDRLAVTFVEDGTTTVAELDYAGLDAQAGSVAALLHDDGIHAGDRVLLALPTGPEFVSGLLGCSYVGAIPVPAFPAERGHPGRLASIVADCRPAAVLAAQRHEIGAVPAHWPARVLTAADADPGRRVGPRRVDADEAAFLQYTSGSTREPRGVIVTHRSLLANEADIADACAHDETTVFVGWAPLFHDLGLVANLLQPLWLGGRSVLMSPVAFLRRPLDWLRCIAAFRASTSGAPDFAYALCAERIESGQLAGLDLSSWRVAFCSAEPVRPETLERFGALTGPVGFARSAWLPCYGLAENTLLATRWPDGPPTGPTVLAFDASALTNGRAELVHPSAATPPARRLVGCGRPAHGTDLAIVEVGDADAGIRAARPHGRRLPTGHIGEIWLRGTGVAGGYWGRPQESAAVFGGQLDGAGGWLRTGDLGFVRDGQVFVTGRVRDVIVLRGENHYAGDIEASVAPLPEVHGRGVIAFADTGENGAERLVVAVTPARREAIGDGNAFARQVRAAVARDHGVLAEVVIIVARGGLPTTSSGKPQRSLCRTLWHSGRLRMLACDVVATPDSGSETRELLPWVEVLATSPQRRRSVVLEALVRSAAARAGVPSIVVDPTDPVSAIGLDSLAAQSLHHDIESAWPVRVPPGTLLADGGLPEVARLTCERADDAATTGAREPGTSIAAEEFPRPLTAAEASIWIEERRHPASTAYVLVRAVSDEGAVRRFDPAGLVQAVDRLVARHPVLRARVVDAPDGTPRLDLAPERPRLRIVPARTRIEHDAEVTAARRRKLDLSADPPFDALLVVDPDRSTLVLTVHHLIADRRAAVMLLDDLDQAYAGSTLDPGSDGASLITPASPVGHDTAWWEHALAGAEEPDLRRGRLVGPARTGRGASIRTGFAGADGGVLSRAARRYGTTETVVLLAALASALGDATGQRRLIVGVVSDGRSRPADRQRVACHAHLVPVPIDIHPADTLSTRLSRCHRALAAALQHGETPLTAVSRARSDDPLAVRVAIASDPTLPAASEAEVLATGGSGRVDWCGAGNRMVALGAGDAQRTLTVGLAPDRTGRALIWDYDPGVLDRVDVARLANRVHDEVTRCADGDGVRRAARTERPTQPATTYSDRLPAPGGDLVDLIARASADRPDAVLVSGLGADAQFSARAVWRAAERVADDLRRRDVSIDDRVAVCLAGDVQGPAVLTGILRSGAAYLPLDPGWPAARLVDAIAAARPAAAIVTDQDPDCSPVRDALLAAGIPVLQPAAVTAPDLSGAHEVRGLPAHLPAQRSAYVLFTSGSTGVPKAVVVPHSGLVNRITWMQSAYRIAPGDRVLHKTPLGFDVSAWEWLWPLATGARALVPPAGTHRDARAIAAAIDRCAVTVLHAVPSLLPALCDAAGPAGLRLRHLVSSGEVLTAALAERAASGGAQVHNLYGPTEAAIDVTAWSVPRGADHMSIGSPIDNVRVDIVDESLDPVRPGAVGELVVAGVAPARGYLGAPALTAAAFVPDPRGARGSRAYRTGDRGRAVAAEHGTVIEYAGRSDSQVKLHGRRLELGEVEAALLAVRGVQEASAAVVGSGASARLAAWVAGRDLDPGAVRADLTSRLAPASVPAQVHVVERLDRLPSGKVDRAGLARRLPAAQRQPAAASAAGAGWIEDGLRALFAEVLDRDDIGLDTDFHAAGGDSLSAIRLVGLARARGIAVDVPDLLRHPSVGELAGQVTHGPPVDSTPAHPAPTESVPPFALIPAAVRAALPPDAVDAWPLSGAHQAMLFHAGYSAGAETYVTLLDVVGDLQPERLRRAVADMAAVHPYLRSTLHPAGYGAPVQVVWARPVADLLTVTDGADRAGWLERTRRTPIEPTREPLVRFALFPAQEGPAGVAVISFALDGWTASALLGELLRRHADALPTGWQPPQISPADFVALESAARESDAHRQFWRSLLVDAPATELPAASSQHAPTGPRTTLQQRIATRVPQRLVDLVTALAAEHATSPRVVLLAAHALAVSSLVGDAAVTVGLGVSGRPAHSDADRVVGVFNNIVPFPVRLAGRSGHELIDDVARLDARIAGFARLPTADIQRLDGRRTRFATLFKYTRFTLYSDLADLPGLRVVGGEAPDQTHVPISTLANVDPLDGGLDLLVDHDPVVVATGLATEFSGRQLAALSALVRDPGAAAGHIAARAAAAPTAAPTDDIRDRPAQRRDADLRRRLVSALAARPDAVVVADDAGQLTAAGLLRAADALGAELGRSGVGAESVVAVSIEPSRALVIAWLGALVAGAAVLPLDPALPRQRRDELLTDSAACALVTESDAERPAARILRTRSPATGRTRIHPRQAAWLIYTSGSTGRPKGVFVEHEQATTYLESAVRAYGGGRTLLATSPAVDLTITPLLVPLLADGSVRLTRDRSLDAIAHLLDREPFDLVKLTPTHLSALRQLRRPHRARRARPARLVVGGEALRADHVLAWDAGPGAVVVNEYGPTETTVGCVIHEQAAVASRIPPVVPIGMALPHVLARVVRDHVDFGTWSRGELWIGGAQVARGYFGRPADTAAAFVPDPAGRGRVYRTGDAVLRMDGGQLHYLGRLDRQVKIRGHRVEPGEIESALAALPGVAAATVTTRAVRGSHQLVAYVVPLPGGCPEVADLRAMLAARLPDHLVPATIRYAAELPLTPGGKLDLDALSDGDSAEQLEPAMRAADDEAILRHLDSLTDEEVGTMLRRLDSTDAGAGYPLRAAITVPTREAR